MIGALAPGVTVPSSSPLTSLLQNQCPLMHYGPIPETIMCKKVLCFGELLHTARTLWSTPDFQRAKSGVSSQRVGQTPRPPIATG